MVMQGNELELSYGDQKLIKTFLKSPKIRGYTWTIKFPTG